MSSQITAAFNQDYSIQTVTNRKRDNGIQGTTEPLMKILDNSVKHENSCVNDTKVSFSSPHKNNSVQTNLESVGSSSSSSENKLDPIEKTNANRSNSEFPSNSQLLIDFFCESPVKDSSEKDTSITNSIPSIAQSNLLLDYYPAESVPPLIKVSETSSKNPSVDLMKDPDEFSQEVNNQTTSQKLCKKNVRSISVDEKKMNAVLTENETCNADLNNFEDRRIATSSGSIPSATEEMDTDDAVNKSVVEGFDKVTEDCKDDNYIANRLQPTMEQQHETSNVANIPHLESHNAAKVSPNVSNFVGIDDISNKTKVLDAEINDTVTAVEFPKEVTVTDEEFEQFWNDNSLGMKRNDFETTADSTSLNSESAKPEVMSVAMTKNMCTNNRENLEGAESTSFNAESSLVDDTSGKTGRDSGNVSPMDEVTVAGNTPRDHSVTDIIDLPSDILISEQEFENFIAGSGFQEGTSEGQSATVQPVTTSENVNIETGDERIDSAPEDSSHCQNSMTPTDHDLTNDYPSPSYSSLAEPGVERPDNLEFANANMGRFYEDSTYLSTPPPPYSPSEEGTYQHTIRRQVTGTVPE